MAFCFFLHTPIFILKPYLCFVLPPGYDDDDGGDDNDDDDDDDNDDDRSWKALHDGDLDSSSQTRLHHHTSCNGISPLILLILLIPPIHFIPLTSHTSNSLYHHTS